MPKREPLYPHVPKGKEVLFPHMGNAWLKNLIDEVPDVDDPSLINYWVTVGDKEIYLEGWSDKCLAGTGFPSIEDGEWDEKIDYIKDLTPSILERKAKERSLELVRGGFVEKTDEDYPEHLYGVTYGIYRKKGRE